MPIYMHGCVYAIGLTFLCWAAGLRIRSSDGSAFARIQTGSMKLHLHWKINGFDTLGFEGSMSRTLGSKKQNLCTTG